MEEYHVYGEHGIKRRITIACITVCSIILIIFGFLYIMPQPLIQSLKPILFIICIVFPASGYYRWREYPWLLSLLVYYVFVFLLHPITPTAVNTFLSLELFGLFFFFCGCRVWSANEIRLILHVLCFACAFQAGIVLASNPNLLGGSGAQHIRFLGVEMNRNPVAFSITPGALCSTLFLSFNQKRHSVIITLLYYICALICSFTVLALGCRSAFLSMAGGIVLIIWDRLSVEKDTSKSFIKKIVFIIAGTMLVLMLLSLVSGTYSSRLFQFGTQANDSGRTEIWKKVWAGILEKPIFGRGYDGMAGIEITMGTHNSFLTIMTYSGFVGGLLLIATFLQFFFNSVFVVKTWIPLSFIVEAFMHSCSESGMDYFAYMPMIIAAIFLQYLKYNKNGIMDLFF